MAKIYVASSWRNAFQPAVVEKLREQGHEVYDFRNPPNRKGFAWSDIDPDWQNWNTDQYREALKHPIAKAGFESDFNAMQEADICVLVLPCGRSANAEAGCMKGAGKKVYVLQKQHEEPELMYMMFDGVFGSEEELIKALAQPVPASKDTYTAHVFGRRNGNALYCFEVESDKHLVGYEVKIQIIK